MPKMTVRVILKSGVEFSIKCDKFTLTRNGFQQVTGYNIEGITENKPVYLDFEQVAAVVRVFADEKLETDDAPEEKRLFTETPIQRAGADSAAGKELFNMKENKHGFEPKQEFTMGGIAWTVIQTGADWAKCITSDCVEERAFDEGNKNDFAASSLRAYLNGEFLRRLIKAGAPEEMFEPFNIDLTADDGLNHSGGDRVRIGLITCEEYRLLRGNIPALPDRWWWTATPDSPTNNFVRNVDSGGSLSNYNAYVGNGGVRPLCNLKSEILVSYLNGENAEEQKKRAEAVDMMKHIADAWDIDAEEVFGRADE